MLGHLAQDEQIIFTKLYLLLSSLKSLHHNHLIFQDKSNCFCTADIFITHNSMYLCIDDVIKLMMSSVMSLEY